MSSRGPDVLAPGDGLFQVHGPVPAVEFARRPERGESGVQHLPAVAQRIESPRGARPGHVDRGQGVRVDREVGVEVDETRQAGVPGEIHHLRIATRRPGNDPPFADHDLPGAVHRVAVEDRPAAEHRVLRERRRPQKERRQKTQHQPGHAVASAMLQRRGSPQARRIPSSPMWMPSNEPWCQFQGFTTSNRMPRSAACSRIFSGKSASISTAPGVVNDGPPNPRPVHRFRHRHPELQHVKAVLQHVLKQADARRAGSHHRPVAPEDDVRGHVGRNPVAGTGHDPQEVGARGADAHPLGEEAVAPRVGHARVEDGRDVAGRVHHRHVVAARGRGRLAGARDRVPHLEQVEPHPRVVLREDRLERQRMARRIVLPAALGIDQVADPDHLEQALGGFDRRAESLQIEELQHVQHLDDVGAAVVRGRGTGDLEIPIRPPRRLLPARLPAFEVLRGQDAARGLDHLADLLREVPPVEVVVPLLGEPLQGVRGLLLVERRAGAGDRVPVEEDPAARGGAADLLGLDEDFAPEERVHLEAFAGVGDRIRHEFLSRQRSVAVVGRLEATPPAGHRHPAPRGEVVRAVAGKRRHRRVHVAVDIGGLAGRLVEIQSGRGSR